MSLEGLQYSSQLHVEKTYLNVFDELVPMFFLSPQHISGVFVSSIYRRSDQGIGQIPLPDWRELVRARASSLEFDAYPICLHGYRVSTGTQDRHRRITNTVNSSIEIGLASHRDVKPAILLVLGTLSKAVAMQSRQYVSRFVPSNPRVLLPLLFSVAVVNSAVSTISTEE